MSRMFGLSISLAQNLPPADGTLACRRRHHNVAHRRGYSQISSILLMRSFCESNFSLISLLAHVFADQIHPRAMARILRAVGKHFRQHLPCEAMSSIPPPPPYPIRAGKGRGSLSGRLGPLRRPVVITAAACNAAPGSFHRPSHPWCSAGCGRHQDDMVARSLMSPFQEHQPIRNQVPNALSFFKVLPCAGRLPESVSHSSFVTYDDGP